MRILTEAEVLQSFEKLNERRQSPYYAMYSSWFKGVVKDPKLMLLPIDDHIVHRGDGVFEAFRINSGKIYDMNSHMQRLKRSADAISLELPHTLDEISQIVIETAKVAAQSDAVIRLYVSRGPGGFTANPYESLGACLYVVITPFSPLPERIYSEGAIAGLATIPMKENPWSAIKSCNYLQNVLMKKEAKDTHCDFTVSVSKEGLLGEGATENFALVLGRKLVAPTFENTLRGTTLERVMALAKENASSLGLDTVQYADMHKDVLASASEAFFIGTTVEVSPVKEIGGQTVGGGKPGPVAKGLRRLLHVDMSQDSEFTTSIF